MLQDLLMLDRYAEKVKRPPTLGDLVLFPLEGGKRVGKVTKVLGSECVIYSEPDAEEYTVETRLVDVCQDTCWGDIASRVAHWAAEVERTDELHSVWDSKFYAAINSKRFVPGGRILAGAGVSGQAIYNCFVIPSPHDSRGGIMRTLTQMTEIMSRGGGVGIDLSSLRPKFARVHGVNGRSSGSVSWGGVYSYVTGLIEQGGSRRGALMLILDVWHPDIEEFINVKRDMSKITNANISVSVTGEFMDCVREDKEWELVFPDTTSPIYENWRGNPSVYTGPMKVHKVVRARDLWDQMAEAAWASGEPGLFFVDVVRGESNSWYYAPLRCTNPCGEQPLPDWGVCNLGALNLSRFVVDQEIDWKNLETTIKTAVRFLDNVIDATDYFIFEVAAQQKKERRIGLGTMGLAEMLIKLEIRYGSRLALDLVDKLYGFIANVAYQASCALAKEKGVFPAYDQQYWKSGFSSRLLEGTVSFCQEYGMRNVTLLTQAPTGTTATMMGTSTGIEPYFSFYWEREGLFGKATEYARPYEEWLTANLGADTPDYFVTSNDLQVEEHVSMQAAIQKWTDSSVSKTLNLPNSASVKDVKDAYDILYDLGCKGGTVYRDGSRDKQVLTDLSNKAKEEPKSAEVVARPTMMPGNTVKVRTPQGNMYLTMNLLDSRPFEVFVNLSKAKAGSDASAMTEALGRLISLILRLGGPLNAQQRLAYVVGQLSGIAGSQSVGFGAEKVLSIPDAISTALVMACPIVEESLDLPDESQADICPECGNSSFVRAEGCQTCLTCGHSIC